MSNDDALRGALVKLGALRYFLGGWQLSDSCKRNDMETECQRWIDGISDLYALEEALAASKPEPRYTCPFNCGWAGTNDHAEWIRHHCKPEPQAQAEPEVVAWVLGNPRYAHSSNIVAAREFTPDVEHVDDWMALITLQAHREAMAKIETKHKATFDHLIDVYDSLGVRWGDNPFRAIAKKDAALKACVGAAKSALKAMCKSADMESGAVDELDAAIQQAEGALK